MKSGSLRVIPGPPKFTTACGTSSWMTMRLPKPCGAMLGTGVSSALAGSAPKVRSIRAPGGRGVDVADDRHLERVARQHPAHIGLQVVDGDVRNRFERAVDRPAVGMIGEGRRPPLAARHVVRAHGLAPQPRHDLRAHALDRVGVEARLGQGEPQQVEGFVAVLLERAQGAAEIVAAGAEAQLDRLALEPVVEGLAVEGPAPSSSRLAVIWATPGLSAGSWSALPSMANSTAISGSGAVAHQPGLDAAGADDALDGHCFSRRGRERKRGSSEQGEQGGG